MEYRHIQETENLEWYINHKTQSHPIIQVYRFGDEDKIMRVYPHKVIYKSNDDVVVMFHSPIRGFAILL